MGRGKGGKRRRWQNFKLATILQFNVPLYVIMYALICRERIVVKLELKN